jgi:hypothetical protein
LTTPPPRSALLNDHLPALIARAERESLRSIARALGVSHEAVRTALRAAGRADLLADLARRRRLKAAAPAPPPPPRKSPLARHAEVRQLCARQPHAAVAALFGVSQATSWRIVHAQSR